MHLADIQTLWALEIQEAKEIKHLGRRKSRALTIHRNASIAFMSIHGVSNADIGRICKINRSRVGNILAQKRQRIDTELSY